MSKGTEAYFVAYDRIEYLKSSDLTWVLAFYMILFCKVVCQGAKFMELRFNLDVLNSEEENEGSCCLTHSQIIVKNKDTC